jgi:hypothetical protein
MTTTRGRKLNQSAPGEHLALETLDVHLEEVGHDLRSRSMSGCSA